MTKITNFVLLSTVIIFLNGCDGLIETEVKLSDLQNPTKNKISGNLYIEVAACSDYLDSRKTSDSVKESKQTVPSIFKDAKYIECFQKEFQSFTHFKIPMIISKKNELISNDYIHIISNKENLLGVKVPLSIKKNMDRVKVNTFGMTDIDLSVTIKFINDTNENLSLKVISSYINEIPYIYGELALLKNSSFVVRLSNVSVDNALRNQFSPVLVKK